MIDDIDPELSLFWLASLPIAFYYFLDAKKGLISNLLVFALLLCFTLLKITNTIPLLYNSSLMFQISIGYLFVAYWVYLVERERSVYASSLVSALEGQEVLFKEVHHRTKNNMQVIMGLLETQSFKVSDPQYKKMFQSHVERIKAMSMVHENLYKNELYEKVDMHKYLGELCENLQKFTPHTILTDIDFVYLDIKISMSLGLILNEAVSNAIEHAYSMENGYIDVSLKCIEESCQLQIKDYGKGMDIDKEYSSSLGMTLIDDLSSSLPSGKMNLKIDDGTEINIEFTLPKEKV
jgi:two-component sensor histidine kinase